MGSMLNTYACLPGDNIQCATVSDVLVGDAEILFAKSCLSLGITTLKVFKSVMRVDNHSY